MGLLNGDECCLIGVNFLEVFLKPNPFLFSTASVQYKLVRPHNYRDPNR